MKTKYIYPKNKELFKELILFAKKIIKICKDNKITPVIYGSFAHFYHTKDENMKVNDIDILVRGKNLVKVTEVLKENKIKFRYYPEHSTIIIKKGKLRVEIDNISSDYRTIKKDALPRRVDKTDFYGIEVWLLTLKHLEEMYPIAYTRSVENKARIKKKIKHLEKFLGRKFK
ncbi:MAG: hypothetical protein ABIA78_02235 [archaeon]